jgi:plasmid stabilization system protein ParE
MVEGIYQIVWTKRAQQHMKQAYLYISNDSSRNAVKVLEDIAAAVEKL